MKKIRRQTIGVFLTCAALLAAPSVFALITVGRGNDPIQDVGWPEGAVAVANLKTRVGWWEGPPFGGGEWQFLYRGGTAEFNEALAGFAAIRAPALELVLHVGPGENGFLRDDPKSKTDIRVDWTFTVWNPASWNHLYNNPKVVFMADSAGFRKPVDPPRLDVYIGGGGSIDWSKIKVPTGVNVRDERASAAGVNPVGGALVRGDVFDMNTGKPVTGARVMLSKQSGAGYEKVAEGVSDSSGRVEIEKIPAGTLRLSVAADGHAPVVVGHETYRENTFKHFIVELAKEASLRGTVSDTDGQPIGDVTVGTMTVLASNGRGYKGLEQNEVKTDSHGQFELAGLPEGFVELYVRAAGYHFDDPFVIHEVPGTNIVLRLSRAGGLHVSVVDKDGKPISQFEGTAILVEVEPKGGSRVGSWGGSGQVKEDGTIDFSNMPPGDYRVSSHPNPSTTNREYVPPQMVTVKPGAPINLKFIYN